MKNRYLHTLLKHLLKTMQTLKGVLDEKSIGIYFILCVNIRYFRCFCFYRYWSNTFFSSFVVTLPPSISLTVRRLHDINLSGWFTLYMLIMLIPVIGEAIAIIISIVIGVVQGSAESNKFGENPVISNK